MPECQSTPELVMGGGVGCVDFISDLHLQASEPQTFDAWAAYLRSTPCQALFVLGDLLEVWVGDDALDDTESGPFWQACADHIRELAERIPVYFMPGNRDFLLGERFLNRAGMQRLNDPTTLVVGSQRWLLSHGDELCLSDLPYQAFRAKVRTSQWRTQFLEQTLQSRIAIAREIRTKSEQGKAENVTLADVDEAAAEVWLKSSKTTTLIHGHTHQAATHRMPQQHVRHVLSDWDANAHPPRLQVLRGYLDGRLERVDLSSPSP